MLALIKNNEYHSMHGNGSRITFDGIVVMPAMAGWSNGDYSLHEIQPADPVPEGKIVTVTSIQNIEGVWTYVNTLENKPVLTPEELRAHMPDKTPREFRDTLTFMGIMPPEVTAKIIEIPFDIERQYALNAWEVMTPATRTDPYIDMIGVMFDKTPEQIDAAWVVSA